MCRISYIVSQEKICLQVKSSVLYVFRTAKIEKDKEISYILIFSPDMNPHSPSVTPTNQTNLLYI